MATTEHKGEWTALDVPDRSALPPALRVNGPICHSIGFGGYYCTRSKGHTGRHAANGTKLVLAVWN